jgi:hypothetical protein
MRTATISVFVLALALMITPVAIQADALDDCPRVGAYIERVDHLAGRAAPIIRESGSRQAMALLDAAVGELRIAHRAYDAGQCRMAFSSVQSAENMIQRALSIIHRRSND